MNIEEQGTPAPGPGDEYKTFLVSKLNELHNSIGNFQKTFYELVSCSNPAEAEEKKKKLLGRTDDFIESHTRMMAEIYFLKYVLEERRIKLEEQLNEINRVGAEANAITHRGNR